MAKLYTPDEVQKIEETKKADKVTKPQDEVRIHRMPQDFRLDKRRGGGPFGKVTDAEADALGRRMLRRESSWIGRGRGY